MRRSPTLPRGLRNAEIIDWSLSNVPLSCVTTKQAQSPGRVARNYGVHIDTATRHAGATGVPVRPSLVKIRPEDLPTIAQLHAQGWSSEAIERKYECTGLAVAKRLRAYEASSSGS